jgi:NAD(P)-dependent dehydrogenase (short-subunit alcohol dehydrogenase family)
MQISGISTLVTGGASGLGLGTARELVARGAKVVLLDLPSSPGEEAAKELGDAATFVAADVTDTAGVEAALDAAEANGPLRAVVHCAGRGGDRLRIIDKERNPGSIDSFNEVLRVNLTGTYNVLRLSAARMSGNDLADGERGTIVLTASVAAFEGQIGQVAYAASKGGIVAMTLPMARELASSGIRVVTIAPGVFLTPMAHSLPPEVQQALAKQIPFPARLGHPEEYASLVAQIVENVMLNGETIRLDGALRLPPR